MTFSFGVKKELCEIFPKSYKEALSEISGIIRVMGTFVIKSRHEINFKISTENEVLIRYIEKIMTKYFSIKFKLDINRSEYFSKVNIYSLVMCGEYVYEFLEVLGIINLEGSSISLNNEFSYLSSRKSFIKGLFLGCGSMSNPEKGYHLEFVTQNLSFGEYLVKCLNYYNLNSKIIKRKFYYIVYIKESENISNILNLIGAHKSLLEFENIRVVKEYSNNKNRIRNCIEANEDKLIITSVRQVRAIMLIEEKLGFKELPKNLREIAEVRLKYKEMSLKDLGKFLSPPIGKSGVSHRLKKIEEIAKNLEKKYKDDLDNS